jgi:hypothetical protein
LRALLYAIALAALCVRAASADAPSAQAFYASAVEAMRELPQPQYLTYAMEGEGDGFSVGLLTMRHMVWLGIRAGSTPSTWRMRHRTDDYATEIVDEAGIRYVSQRSFFDPTWYGAFRALRDGLIFYQDVEPPLSTAATPAPMQTPDLRTIAVVRVLGAPIYRAADAGPARCSNGDPGHALHLVSRDRVPQHQLTEVVVDLRSMRFCSMRFGMRDGSGFRGFVEEHYADVGGYWLQTDGVLDATERAFGFATHHGIWRYRFTELAFPPTISGAAFVRPSSQ